VPVTASPVELDVPAVPVVPLLPVTGASLVGASVVGLALVLVLVLVTAVVVWEPVVCVVVLPSPPQPIEPTATASTTPEAMFLRGFSSIASG